MNKDDFCKGGIGTGEAGGEAQRWGRREAARVGTSESCILQQALTHWEDDHSAVPFLLRLRNSQSTELYSASSRGQTVRCRREGAGDHEALNWEAGVSPGAQPAAGVAAEAPCSSWRGEFPVHVNRGSAPQPGWALEPATPVCALCAAGSRLRCCQHCCSPRGTRTPWSQTWSVPAGTGVTWQRCHMGEVSPGRNVTWQSCHPAPCGQLGTVSGDAVVMFVISCPAHYA